MSATPDRELWVPDDINHRASSSENTRVRELLQAELQRMVDADPRPWGPEQRWGHARGTFAREWVGLAEQLGIHVPGQDQRTPLRDNETAHGRRVDAARTRIRQFLAGHSEQDWVLAGIESTVCDRRGMAPPPSALRQQQAIPGL